MKKNILIWIGLVASAGVAGCGANDRLLVTYTQACHLEGTNYMVKSLTFEGVEATTTATAYAAAGGATCPDAEKIYTLVYRTKTDTPGGLEGAPVPTLKLNSIMRSVTWTWNTSNPTTLGGLNAVQLCGISNWAQNVAQDVTGKTCNQFPSSFGNTFFTAAGGINYAVQRFDGNNLYLFDGTLQSTAVANNGVNEATRITTLETTPFVRQ